MGRTLLIMLAGLLLCACVPIQPEPMDGSSDLANALAKLDEHPDPTEYLELVLALDVCVREVLEGEGDASPALSEEESVAMTIYALGALMGARIFEWNEAIRSGALGEEEALSGERGWYQSLLLAGAGCEGFEAGS